MFSVDHSFALRQHFVPAGPAQQMEVTSCTACLPGNELVSHRRRNRKQNRVLLEGEKHSLDEGLKAFEGYRDGIGLVCGGC